MILQSHKRGVQERSVRKHFIQIVARKAGKELREGWEGETGRERGKEKEEKED